MNNDRLDNLITAFMDQTISETEMRELDAILAESSEAALRFAQLTTLDSLLEDHFGEQKALNQTEDALLKLIQQSPAPAPTPIPKPAKKRSLSIGLFKTAIAAGLLIGIGFWFLRDTPTATPQPTPPVENKTPAPMAYIQQFSGDVVIQRAQQRIPATQQMILESGDRLISQTDASVEIRYASEATTLTLTQMTQVTLLLNDGAKTIQLHQGALQCDAAPQPVGKPMILTTALARATVVGTRFSLSTAPTATRLTVEEGKVVLLGLDTQESSQTEAGWFAQINANGSLETGRTDQPPQPQPIQPQPEPAPEPQPEPEPEIEHPQPEPELQGPGLYSIRLQLQRTQPGVHITPVPKLVLPFDMIDGSWYDYHPNYKLEVLDAPIRNAAKTLLRIEQEQSSRSTKKRRAALPLLEYTFRYATRHLNGQFIDSHYYRVRVQLDEEPGKCRLIVGKDLRMFEIAQLKEEQGYLKFLNAMLTPESGLTLKAPTDAPFMTDLYMRYPIPIREGPYGHIFAEMFPGRSINSLGAHVRSRPSNIHLGVTFTDRENGDFDSSYLHIFAKAVRHNRQAVIKGVSPQYADAIPLFEKLLQRMPSNRLAAQHLLRLYVREGRDQDASQLVKAFQPLFVTVHKQPIGVVPSHIKKELRKIKKNRRKLNKQTHLFKPNNNIFLQILEPGSGDLISGETQIDIALSDTGSPLLRLDYSLNGNRFASLQAPPFRTLIPAGQQEGEGVLQVKAYFEDRTYAQTQIPLQIIKTQEQQAARLVELQVVAEGASQLHPDNLSLIENGSARTINKLQPVTAPLRIAILMDTSLSMSGTALYQAQYAIDRFLSGLKPQDQISLTSFDEKVMRLSGFTSDFQSLKPLIYTMSPQLNTSLYDALLVAHHDLLKQDGIRVILVLSDGRDTSSAATREHVLATIGHSPIRVYGIGLERTSKGDPGFLKELSQRSGSFSRTVKQTDTLDSIFTEINRELQSLHYLNYYSPIQHRNQRNLNLNSRSDSITLRWMAEN